jgi:protoheme IX farnesyltransferase
MNAAATVLPRAAAAVWTRALDYLELTKPRVAGLVLFTVAAGACLAARGVPDPIILVHILVGTALVVGGASALNQLLERQSDALMRRTESRPLPAGRLQPLEGLIFGLLLAMAGLTYLGLALHRPLAALIAGFALISYVFLYTPLKRKTSLNTLVGAVPGALPPVIGWTAVTGSIGSGAAILFVLIFLWQIPHFLAIARIYREDYARAGLLMLPVVDRNGDVTGRQMVSYCLALIPVSLTPGLLGLAGRVYIIGALFLGLGFLAFALRFNREHSVRRARQVLWASLIYLPLLLTLLLVDNYGTFRP